MLVRVQYFGVLRDALGQGVEVNLDEGSTVGTLLQRLREKSDMDVWVGIAVAVNCEYANRTRVLADGDDVAILPPVSGGCRPRSQSMYQTNAVADAC